MGLYQINGCEWPGVFISLAFERPYLMAGLNLMFVSLMKSTLNPQILMKSADSNEISTQKSADFRVEIHSHLSDLNRETSNNERPLAWKDNPQYFVSYLPQTDF